ncbi:alanyl-tRNA editing protein [Propioniciclava tarda]|uniref:Alanyl-tRNA editing protein n=1 Tax=Propioniciclava tarda TaxID=433330 RepID=A0A4Q9KKI2_PROTD|nr:alanyl-tRNA editing protein [Propioniciclava tarda]TBT94380.1 alanyl-tRNA editing protein [Propioniciclava tarda]SMO72616.1 misacylated tRNA(Ala) deacylase [Propioniciclava tarda]
MTARLDLENANVTSWVSCATAENGRLRLDASAFFPGGGGQPADTGRVRFSNGNEAEVTGVHVVDGEIEIEVDADVPDGVHVLECALDAPRRRALMRTHTAFHILSAVLGEDGAEVTGCQLEPGRARGDFSGIDAATAKAAVERADALASEGHEVTIELLPRAQFAADPSLVRLATDLVPDVDPVRVVNIAGIDRQADGGTHVMNTAQIGRIVFDKFENKGARNKRITFSIADA